METLITCQPLFLQNSFYYLIKSFDSLRVSQRIALIESKNLRDKQFTGIDVPLLERFMMYMWKKELLWVCVYTYK